jgi:hypothetical protein
MGKSWGLAAALQNQDERRAPDCHIGRELERLEGVRCVTASRPASLRGTSRITTLNYCGAPAEPPAARERRLYLRSAFL